MPLTLYYLESSPPGRSVDLVIHALGLSAQYKLVDMNEKEHMSPDYMRLNPLHTVPTIDDDGFVLWESRAIMTYLVSKYGKDDSLYPKDLIKRSTVDQRLHYSNDVFYILKQLIKAILYFNVKSIPAEQLSKVRDCQENIEKLLKEHEFMAGDTLTVADYSYITLVDLLEAFSQTESTFPITKAWTERCKSSMKDFEEVNKKGAEQLIAIIKSALFSIS